MKKFINILKVTNQASRVTTSLLNYVPQRGARYDTKITWKEPEKYTHYHSLRTGDRASLIVTNPLEIHVDFRDSKELETADDKVKKIFSLGYLKHRNVYEHFKHELMEKVKDHPFDRSTSVKIAEFTAKIRHFQNIINAKPSRNGSIKAKLDALVGKRRALLRKLRTEDYKKFEWLLEQLDLEFRPGLPVESRKVTRKNALILLARLKAEKIKEEKLAEVKKKFDDRKIPFLEEKMAKLKRIKEMEERVGLPPTVTDEDIQKCMEKLEKVKLDLTENSRIGYLRKIHPYFIEPYHENLLREKEAAGQLLTEQMLMMRNKKSSGETAS